MSAGGDVRQCLVPGTVDQVTGGPESATLRDAVESRRRETFVGRTSECELFAAALAAEDAPFSVLFVHGPGGIGKSALLDEFASQAGAADAMVVRVDGRAVVPTPDAVLAALGESLDVPTGGGPITGPTARVVLLVDSYEELFPLDEWLRVSLLPRLPASSLTVLAGRARPAPGWRTDAGWRDLVRIVSLRNLEPAEAERYLALSDVPAEHHDRLVGSSYGHPLALALLADVVRRGGQAQLDPLDPDLVATLVRRFVDVVPDEHHRRGLEVCALARATTEPLLREALGLDDAHDLFRWLRSLPFVDAGPHGLVPHDLARDVLDRDLRWRDREAYGVVFRNVRRHIHRRLGGLHGLDLQRAILDEKSMFRNLPSVLSPVDWDIWGEHFPEPAAAGHRGVIVDMVNDHEGPDSAAIAARWWELQPDAFFVVRDDDRKVRGFIVLVTLPADRGVVDFDPGAQAAWDHAASHAPPRPGEPVTQTRFVVDRELHQAPSPTLNAVPVLTMQRYLETPKLAWDFLTLADPDPFDQYFAIADLPRAVGADFTVGDRRYGLFAHDFRRVPVDRWFDVVTERALAQDPTMPPARPTDAVLLSQVDFSDAVRRALRDLTRPDLLARNPLQRARLVTADAEHRNLESLIRNAIEDLRAHPRDEKRWRALERTYLRPAPTQEAAAELLGLPFSTYRRHLTEGVNRVVAHLWEVEVYGPPSERNRAVSGLETE